jgi:molybdopterin-guanine dinucleotide biosynthesis protein A
MTIENLSAAVLTGGQSRRMGTDKALLTLGGRTLVERTLECLRQLTSDVRVIGDRPAYRAFGAPVEADLYPGTGTLGGIATALATSQHEFVLVVACDMPFLSESLLRRMAEIPRDYDVLVPITSNSRSQQGGSTTYETLHAIYRRTCLPYIEAELRAGRLKVIGFFEHVRIVTLDEQWLHAAAGDLRSLLNTNDAEEFAEAQRMYGTGGGVSEGRR